MKPPIYQTPRFTLKAYTPKDENPFVAMCIDPVSVTFMGGAEGIEAQERELFQRISKLYEKENVTRWFWIWGVYEGEKLCAHLELKETGHTNPDELEIVYMVHPEHRRKGVMTEVLALLKENQVEWKRKIIATVSPKNIVSLSLLEKWGIDKQEVVKDSDGGDDYLKVWLSQ